jgi:hypothetical protein
MASRRSRSLAQRGLDVVMPLRLYRLYDQVQSGLVQRPALGMRPLHPVHRVGGLVGMIDSPLLAAPRAGNG